MASKKIYAAAMDELVIKTSARGWLTKVAQAYKVKNPIVLVDDAAIGIDPSQHSLLEMGQQAKLGLQEWIAVVIALGVAAAGAFLLVMAIVDPEPFSKMAFTVGSGTTLILGGGFGAIKILTHHRPPNVRVTARGFEIYWD